MKRCPLLVRVRLAAAAFLALAAIAAADEPDYLAQAREIHARILTLDTHLDVPIVMRRAGFDITEEHSVERHASQVDFPRFRRGGLDGGFFSIYLGQGPRTLEGNTEAKERADAIIDDVLALVAQHPDQCALALTPADAERIRQEGKIVIFMGIENGYTIGRDLDRLVHYAQRGVRYFGVTHSANNDLADSSTDPHGYEHFGLSDLGRAAVRLCNELGVMVDVSHMSDKSFYDVLEITRAPIIASHSGSYAVFPHPRNMNDDMLKAVARNGGVVQMNMFSGYLREYAPDPERDEAFRAWRMQYFSGRTLTPEEEAEALAARIALQDKFPRPLATLSDVVDHIDHMVAVMGIDHLGVSGDFDGGGGVEGANDVGELHNLTAEMLRRGYTEEDLEKFWGGNVMRVLGECQRIAAELAEEEEASGA